MALQIEVFEYELQNYGKNSSVYTASLNKSDGKTCSMIKSKELLPLGFSDKRDDYPRSCDVLDGLIVKDISDVKIDVLTDTLSLIQVPASKNPV